MERRQIPQVHVEESNTASFIDGTKRTLYRRFPFLRSLLPNTGVILGDKSLRPGIDEVSDEDESPEEIDRRQLIERIKSKYLLKQELSKEDLSFLYGLNGETITGFTSKKDPIIEEVKCKRDTKKDLATVLGVTTHRISITPDEILKGFTKCHYGDLDFDGCEFTDGYVFPEYVLGNFLIDKRLSPHGFVYPKYVLGNFSLKNITSAEGLVLPSVIGGVLSLKGLYLPEGLKLDRTSVGKIDLSSLTSAEGVMFPDRLKVLYLEGLKSSEGLVLPEAVDVLYLNGLNSTDELDLSGKTLGYVDLSFLTSAKVLRFPDSVKGLYLGSLGSFDELDLPKDISEDLDLDGIKDPDKLDLSGINIGGRLFLRGLSSIDLSKLPPKIGGVLVLNRGLIGEDSVRELEQAGYEVY